MFLLTHGRVTSRHLLSKKPFLAADVLMLRTAGVAKRDYDLFYK